jgi:hypothetical protein
VGTEIGTLLGAAAQLSLAAAFLWASLSKAAAQRGFRQTILQIGVPGRLTRLTASTVIGLELLAGVSLLIVPAWWWPRLLIVMLAVGFAGTGLVAVITGRRVTCRCFGDLGRGRLGWRQVALLPGWLLLAGAAQLWAPGWNVDQGLAVLAVVLFAMIALRLPTQQRAVRKVRADRIALAPGYVRPATEPAREDEVTSA